MKKMKLLSLLILGMSMDLTAAIEDECYTMKPDNYTEKCKVGREGHSEGVTWNSYLMSNDKNWEYEYKTKQGEVEFRSNCIKAAPAGEFRDYFIRRCVDALFSFRESVARQH